MPPINAGLSLNEVLVSGPYLRTRLFWTFACTHLGIAAPRSRLWPDAATARVSPIVRIGRQEPDIRGVWIRARSVPLAERDLHPEIH